MTEEPVYAYGGEAMTKAQLQSEATMLRLHLRRKVPEFPSNKDLGLPPTATVLERAAALGRHLDGK